MLLLLFAKNGCPTRKTGKRQEAPWGSTTTNIGVTLLVKVCKYVKIAAAKEPTPACTNTCVGQNFSSTRKNCHRE